MALTINQINGKIEGLGLKVFIGKEGNKCQWRETDTNRFVRDITCRISDKNAAEWMQEAEEVQNHLAMCDNYGTEKRVNDKNANFARNYGTESPSEITPIDIIEYSDGTREEAIVPRMSKRGMQRMNDPLTNRVCNKSVKFFYQFLDGSWWRRGFSRSGKLLGHRINCGISHPIAAK